jgi:hypothetical protein
MNHDARFSIHALSLRQDAREVILESPDAPISILTAFDPHFFAHIGENFLDTENQLEGACENRSDAPGKMKLSARAASGRTRVDQRSSIM